MEPDTRTRRRVATREALREAALRLFAERGYEATTVRDIADAADVTERTFFRYFPTKSDVLLGDLAAARPVLLAAIQARPAGEPGLQAVLNAALSLPVPGFPLLAFLLPQTGHPFGVPDELPDASLRMLQIFADWEAGLVEVFLERGGGRSDSGEAGIQAEVTARAALGALRTAIQHHRALIAAGEGAPEAFHDLLRTAFAALDVHPS